MVRDIFYETYNKFYLKWKGNVSSEEDVINMVNDAREISRKYRDIELVRHLTIDLSIMLENEFKRNREIP